MLAKLGGIAALAGTASLFLASCAILPQDEIARAEALDARIKAVMARRGLGADALSVIDNYLRHEAPPPPHAPPIVRELLARPAAAADAAALFNRAVPVTLRHWVAELSAEPQATRGRLAVPASLRSLLDDYVEELVEARQLLRSSARGAPIDAQAIIRKLDKELLSADELRVVAAGVDRAMLDRATTRFLDATARFVRALRAAGDRLEFPRQAVRFDSPIGIVAIGSRGDDVHGADAAVIVDPGGNDVYERAPVVGGAVSVIIDLSGDDRYGGSDLVVHGLSAIVDFSGNDRYAMSGPGLGAAIAGASVLIDLEGDDVYEAGLFGQGAAAFGLGAVIDLRGKDSYRLRAGGQGYGLAGGVGLLWDLAGDDTYTASGLADAFDRGGGISSAQGAGSGFRTMLGGGIGILRDDDGNDSYEAQMFAQGVGYYYGAGLLWDLGGDDRYRAARYAQGNGVHEAVGVLRDESGSDRYELKVGVGQGMGLDLAVGLLLDGGGDDRYESGFIAQGAATANGLGILLDAGGADQWAMSDNPLSWGRAEWLRGLPTAGVLLYDPARAVFAREGRIQTPPPQAAEFGGPLGDAPIEREPQPEAACPAVVPVAASAPMPLAEALRRILPGLPSASKEQAIRADVYWRLAARLEASLAELPADEFEVTYTLAGALRCALERASAEGAASMWDAFERVLAAEPATPFASAIINALLARPAPAPQLQRILGALDAHPRCSVRAASLSLRARALVAAAAPAAQAALRSSCWRLQAAALDVLKDLGEVPDGGVVLPSFLGTGVRIAGEKK